MQTLTDSGYIPEELFSQQGSTAEDAKFNKTLMVDLSQQARHPMTIVSADAAYCYDRVNHVIMTNGNIPAIVAAMVPPDNEVLPTHRIQRIEILLWRPIDAIIYYGIRTRK